MSDERTILDYLEDISKLEKRLRSEMLPAETSFAFTLAAHPGDAP